MISTARSTAAFTAGVLAHAAPEREQQLHGALAHVARAPSAAGVLLEAARRDAAGLARRLQAARFEQLVTIEEFDFGFNP